MRKENRNGSVLAWVIIVMMLLFFLMICMITLSGGYHARSVAQNKRRQTFLTASALAEALGENFVNHSWDSRGAAKNILENLEAMEAFGGPVLVLDELEVEGLDPSMGECRVKAVYDKNSRVLELTVACDLDGQRENAVVLLENVAAGKVEHGFDGIRAGEWESENLAAALNSRESGSPNFDVWITGEKGADLAVGERDIIYGNDGHGTFYCNGPVYQSSAVKGGQAPVLGSVISGDSIDFAEEDNAFSIQSQNPYYSLYAYGPGKRSSISLAGCVTVDSEEKRRRMAAEKITLNGPGRETGDSGPGEAKDSRMVVYSRLEGKQEIHMTDSVTVDNDIHSEGTVWIEGNGCRIGNPDHRVIIEGKDIRIDGGREDGSPVEIYGAVTALGTITIEANAPVFLYGDLTAGEKITLKGNVTVEGKAITKEFEMIYDEKQKGQAWMDGSVFASERVTVRGEDNLEVGTDSNGNRESGLMGIEGGNIYLYGEQPEFWVDGIARIGPVWSNGERDADMVREGLVWNNWEAEDTVTAANLREAKRLIGLSDSIELSAILLTSQLPDQKGPDISQIKDPVLLPFDDGNFLELASGGMEVIYSVKPSGHSGEEADPGKGSKAVVEKAEEVPARKAAGGKTEEEGGYRIDARCGADSYLLIQNLIQLAAFDGYGGDRRDPNSYVILKGRSRSTLSVEESLSGYVFGDGTLKLGDHAGFHGICDVGRLVTGENVTITYCPLNAGVASLFTPNWKVIRYGN